MRDWEERRKKCNHVFDKEKVSGNTLNMVEVFLGILGVRIVVGSLLLANIMINTDIIFLNL